MRFVFEADSSFPGVENDTSDEAEVGARLGRIHVFFAAPSKQYFGGP